MEVETSIHKTSTPSIAIATYLDLTVRNLGDGQDGALGKSLGTDGREGNDGESVAHIGGVGCVCGGSKAAVD
jgi:hypothetical protein